MLENSLDIILKGNDNFFCPGHNAEIITDDKGVEWILYHAYKAGDEASGRNLMLDKVTWTSDGWPLIGTGTPSASSNDRPFFN